MDKILSNKNDKIMSFLSLSNKILSNKDKILSFLLDKNDKILSFCLFYFCWTKFCWTKFCQDKIMSFLSFLLFLSFLSFLSFLLFLLFLSFCHIFYCFGCFLILCICCLRFIIFLVRHVLRNVGGQIWIQIENENFSKSTFMRWCDVRKMYFSKVFIFDGATENKKGKVDEQKAKEVCAIKKLLK